LTIFKEVIHTILSAPSLYLTLTPAISADSILILPKSPLNLHQRTVYGCCIWLSLFLIPLLAQAQPGATVQLDKPKRYEKRTLASEKPTDKPLNPLRKAGQNLNTRYNFYYNAEIKINDVLTNAKAAFRDDFSRLLPFYDYSLDQTAAEVRDLDSVVMKCNDAILLHDLRNDWVDDLYLMMGRAYFYKKDFDSAAIAFQYVNYAFQPRKKDEIGYNKYIGSNANETGNVYTIATKEKNNIVTKTLGHTPARNESIVWLTRTLIENNNFNEARALIETLKRDANFPKRLRNDLSELQAYLHYKQENWDSAAHYLELSLSNAQSTQEKARWEFLLAQLHELVGDQKEADNWYDKAINHTTDPILEAYGRINRIRLVSGGDEDKRIDMNIAELMKMVKRDKYEEYKNYIYYAAAQMEISRNRFEPALHFLELSAINSTEDIAFRNMAFLEMGNIGFRARNYPMSAIGYDSVDLADPVVKDPEEIRQRRALLALILGHYETIRVEDSLQKIASMPGERRQDYVRDLVRKMRREKGLKEESAADGKYMGGTSSVTDPTQQAQPVDLFAQNQDQAKGDWYFYNTGMRTQGAREFKAVWGNRPNVDNWRRARAISEQTIAIQGAPKDLPAEETAPAVKVNSKVAPSELSIEALTANLPLTPDMLNASNDSIEQAFYQLARIFREWTDDCEALVKNNETMLNRFPQTRYAEEVLFGLWYCHQKAGNSEKAKFYRDYMSRNFPQGNFMRMVVDPMAAGRDRELLKTAATAKYEEVYNAFIEGDFERAVKDKKKADSTYGENYWTPQLLYIESVYYIRERKDSTAISILKKMMALYPGTPMSEKAAGMIDVLSRRAEIEQYLTNLDIERAKEDEYKVDLDTKQPAADQATRTVKAPGKLETRDPALQAPDLPKEKEKVDLPGVRAGDITGPKDQPLTVKVDSSKFRVPEATRSAEGYVFVPTEQYTAVMLLDKVDVVYVNEARNALARYHRDKYPGRQFEMTLTQFDDTRKIITIAPFNGVVEANDYASRARNAAPSEIFPWMPQDRYSFFIISPANLELLRSRKDIRQYLDLLQQNIPLK